MTIMTEDLKHRKRSVPDGDDPNEFEGGTFRRVVNRPLVKFPRIASAELGNLSVRRVPAASGILTSESTTDKVEESHGDVTHSDEVGSEMAIIPAVRRSDRSGRPLCWQGGRLQSILLHDDFTQPMSISRDTGGSSALVNVATRPAAARLSLSSSSVLRTLQRSAVRGPRRRGRPRKHPGPRGTTGGTEEASDGGAESCSDSPLGNPRVRNFSRKSGRSESQQVQPLLLPIRDSYPPTDLSLPVLDVTAKYDPLAGISADSKSADCPTPTTASGAGQGEDVPTTNNPSSTASLTTGPSGSSSAPVRMKSSGGAGDIDPQELRGYRRLNGYQLFVMVNKKKHESALTTIGIDDASETAETQRDLHRKWQAIWSTLPEKTRKEWKTKAKRLMKQSGQQSNQPVSQASHSSKRLAQPKDRFQNEIRKIENQLARCDSVSVGLVDYAAHFQLLSDSFAAAAKNLIGFEGPVAPGSVETMLLDGLLSCMIPLLALASEEDILLDVPDKRDVSRGLRHLTYILPT